MSEYKMIVQIGRNVTNIISLPCVDGVRKSFGGELFYQICTEDPCVPEYAREGDLLCQDYDGIWHINHKSNSINN